MAYVVKEGRSVIYGDEDGVTRRYVAGETVEGARRGELDGCSAVDWLTAKQAKTQEKPDQEPTGDSDAGEDDSGEADDGESDDEADGSDAGEGADDAEEQGGS